jgi:uncharacterized repeat protein (TIGR01451 family)
MPIRFAPLIAAAALASPALAGPLDLSTRILAERRVAAPDGTVRIVEAPMKGAVPGDRLTVVLSYRNTGTAPLADLQLANPVPAGLAYRGPAMGAPEPEVTVDGRRFAPLAQLTVSGPAGVRAATADDVTQVRWRLSRPVNPGTGGSLGFRAVVK